jgi:hypothetical protein
MDPERVWREKPREYLTRIAERSAKCKEKMRKT